MGGLQARDPESREAVQEAEGFVSLKKRNRRFQFLLDSGVLVVISGERPGVQRVFYWDCPQSQFIDYDWSLGTFQTPYGRRLKVWDDLLAYLGLLQWWHNEGHELWKAEYAALPKILRHSQ